jgi:hypothetical protein
MSYRVIVRLEFHDEVECGSLSSRLLGWPLSFDGLMNERSHPWEEQVRYC